MSCSKGKRLSVGHLQEPLFLLVIKFQKNMWARIIFCLKLGVLALFGAVAGGNRPIVPRPIYADASHQLHPRQGKSSFISVTDF